jgi:hypothetical protein
MDTSQQYGQQNFSLPHDVVKLPSGGVFYKNKKKSVKVGYLTAADENILMAGDSIGKDGLVITLLRNKLYEPDLRPDELLQGDLEAILIFLRNSSFGPEYTVSLIDPETDKKFETTILLDELYIKETKQKPDDEGFFTVKLPKSNSTVKLKPLSFGELNELDKLADQYPVGRIAPKQTWKLNKMVVEVDGNGDVSFITQFIESLPISDAKFIRKFIDENEPRLDLVRKVIAPSGKEIYANISFGVEFFRPFF